MSTNSRIGIEKDDGTVETIYCHYDGYLEGVGNVLQNHYQDRNKIEKLIKLGDISFLGEELSNTEAYHRERNEKYIPPTKNESVDEAFYELDIEYVYIFTQGNGWLVRTPHLIKHLN